MRTTTDLHPARRTRPGRRGPAPTAPRALTHAARPSTQHTPVSAGHPGCAGVEVVAERDAATTQRAGRVRTVARVVQGRVLAGADAGMATAEYAIATVAAVGFAGLLVVVLRSGEVQGLLLGLIRGALSV
ncbi:DUF4244 domain-containing protein [Cellulomonas cellasea]|uniref:DUF4244 domain-containing protein n=1 Tax=Cellulomonas cellasea TaxID=43670 RepID=A0A7W4UDV2_9CELL|nr:DUF4244 domain-containing protein [Cellulomonas cellasea]MBB2922378.1 hypothetical protein [Cellulomonas cellasea]